MIQRIFIFLVVYSFICGCQFNTNSQLPKVSLKVKKAAEQKFGVAFNSKREKIGMHPIADDWKVIENEDYRLYYGKDGDTDSAKGYVYKLIEYDEKLNIISEEDYYRPTYKSDKPSFEDCDETYFSSRYNFLDSSYSYNTACCDICGKAFIVA